MGCELALKGVLERIHRKKFWAVIEYSFTLAFQEFYPNVCLFI